MKQCPYCAEEIQDAAIVCRFCGRDIAGVAPPPIPTAAPPTPSARQESSSLIQPTVVSLGLAGVGCLLALASAPSPGIALLGAILLWVGLAKMLNTRSRIVKYAGTGVIALFGMAILAAMSGASARWPQSNNTASVGSSVGTAAPSQSAAPAPSPARSPQWTQVVSWRGNGIKETETFAVASREWRIRWATTNEPFANAGLLQIMVHDEKGSLVSMAANKQGPGEDVSYVRGRPGRYYLMINSANIDWSVIVEHQQ